MAFPDQGTVVARAVEQSVGLFQAFDYLDAAGNLMVIFTDGADADVLENGKTVDDVLDDALRAKIPVYLIKIGGNIQNKRTVADELWISAVKKTGGEFFRAATRRRSSGRFRPSIGAPPAPSNEAVQHRAAALCAVCVDGSGVLVRWRCCCASRFRRSKPFRETRMRSSTWFAQAVIALLLLAAGAILWRSPEMERRLAAAERDS